MRCGQPSIIELLKSMATHASFDTFYIFIYIWLYIKLQIKANIYPFYRIMTLSNFIQSNYIILIIRKNYLPKMRIL